jgi:hypothetical protein
VAALSRPCLATLTDQVASDPSAVAPGQSSGNNLVVPVHNRGGQKLLSSLGMRRASPAPMPTELDKPRPDKDELILHGPGWLHFDAETIAVTLDNLDPPPQICRDAGPQLLAGIIGHLVIHAIEQRRKYGVAVNARRRIVDLCGPLFIGQLGGQLLDLSLNRGAADIKGTGNHSQRALSR